MTPTTSAHQPPSRLATDLTWMALMVGTALLWLVYDGTIARGATVAPLMGIMAVKAALIAAIFMDLWRASRAVLFALILTMALIGLGVVVLA